MNDAAGRPATDINLGDELGHTNLDLRQVLRQNLADDAARNILGQTDERRHHKLARVAFSEHNLLGAFGYERVRLVLRAFETTPISGLHREFSIVLVETARSLGDDPLHTALDPAVHAAALVHRPEVDVLDGQGKSHQILASPRARHGLQHVPFNCCRVVRQVAHAVQDSVSEVRAPIGRSALRLALHRGRRVPRYGTVEDAVVWDEGDLVLKAHTLSEGRGCELVVPPAILVACRRPRQEARLAVRHGCRPVHVAVALALPKGIVGAIFDGGAPLLARVDIFDDFHRVTIHVQWVVSRIFLCAFKRPLVARSIRSRLPF
mmetsp:Transcript_86946/g.250828  ORF Transcript_86946/g.250828 Transcript_86946/m.250828 type:complete len:320 (-) Transcript_86946:908-1867(-)